jgi:hypothetical protein
MPGWPHSRRSAECRRARPGGMNTLTTGLAEQQQQDRPARGRRPGPDALVIGRPLPAVRKPDSHRASLASRHTQRRSAQPGRDVRPGYVARLPANAGVLPSRQQGAQRKRLLVRAAGGSSRLDRLAPVSVPRGRAWRSSWWLLPHGAAIRARTYLSGCMSCSGPTAAHVGGPGLRLRERGHRRPRRTGPAERGPPKLLRRPRPGSARAGEQARRAGRVLLAPGSAAATTCEDHPHHTRWPSLSSSPWILLYPQPLFSAASRSISAATSALTGGRPVRFG